jgi:hypothetical protein
VCFSFCRLGGARAERKIDGEVGEEMGRKMEWGRREKRRKRLTYSSKTFVKYRGERSVAKI